MVHFVIEERTDVYAAQIQRFCGQLHVRTQMPGIHVDISVSAVTVLLPTTWRNRPECEYDCRACT